MIEYRIVMKNMKTVYQDEKNVVLVENSVELKPCINRESKSLELTIKLYNCHDINMKFLVVVSPPSIYQTALVESGSEVSYLIPEPRKFAEVTKLSENIKKPWLKSTLKEIKNIINNQNFPNSRSK